MTDLEKLEQYLYEKYGLSIEWRRVSGRDGIAGAKNGKPVYLAVDRRLDERKRTAIAYHEAGHLETGSDERKATDWAIAHLMPFEKLVKALLRSPSNVAELAEEMAVDEKLLRDHLSHMAEKRIRIEQGDLTVEFSPVVVKNRKTGQRWPEE